MKNWIYYKDNWPVNMGSIGTVGKTGKITIEFYGDGDNPVIRWIFDSEVERDLMYEALKKQMTEIELDYHPDLED